MFWLLLLPALVLVVVFLLFVPYAVRYVSVLVQMQFLKMAYSVMISCLYLESRWQRWRIYRKNVRLLRKTSREIVERSQDRMRKLYRERS